MSIDHPATLRRAAVPRTRLYDPEFAADPAGAFVCMCEYGEAVPVELAPGVPATLVIGYEAALEVMRDPATFPRDSRHWQRGIPRDCPVLPLMMHRPNCMYTDGEVHTRFRQAVTHALDQIDPIALREQVGDIADELIAGIRADGEGDILAQFARPLPLHAITLLHGCPPGCPAKRPALLIATVAIEKLLDGLPGLRLALPSAEISWRQGPFNRALDSLPVRFAPPAAEVRHRSA